ncbi:MAG: 30S ribosomal protein S1 [Desulfobacteraceae bacterium]|nr:30S ribosomal protein S1 [Desulfobacteraceae bacterium]
MLSLPEESIKYIQGELIIMANENLDVQDKFEGVETMEELLDLYEDSFSRFQEGEVVTGRVISIGRDSVIVDIGYKSEGAVPAEEFKDENGEITVKKGDKIEVMIEFWDEDEEEVVLSKEKAEKQKVWDEIAEIHEKDGIVEGIIINRVKGGFSVDIGVQAFLPGSQADLRPIKNMDVMVGKKFKFKVLKFNKRRSNIVLSRRVILESMRQEQRSATLEELEIGRVMTGTVKNITEYGVFIDLGGVDGLLHITDISWGRVKHPSELFALGDEIEVKILSYDLEKERVSLGMKQLTPDPWETAAQQYPVGSKVKGRVVSLTDYGAFVELEEGIEGLIHVSEMSWTKKVKHPSKMVSVGEEVEAVVLDLKPESRRISLGMKQVEPNPWDLISDKYPVGTIIEGKIKNITDFGLFIGIEDDIDGLVHISDISWTKRIKHPGEVYKKGDTVQAVVLDIDKENERFSLGIKQTQPDPWESAPETYKVGSKISGKITNITDFGIFVELEEGVEGLVHISEVENEKKDLSKEYQIGSDLEAKVMNVNTEERRIGLSVKRLGMDDDEAILKDYMKKIEDVPPTSAFGEMLKENIEEKIKEKEEARNKQ